MRTETENLIAAALQKRAENGRHLHHRDCIHNLPPEQVAIEAPALRFDGNGGHEHERTVPMAEISLQAMARFLLANSEWLRHHRAGHEAVEEITAAIWEVARIIDRPNNRTTFLLGPCPEFECTGEVRVFIPAREDRPAHMACGSCEARWDSVQFLNAGKRILATEADRIRPYVSSSAAAVALGVSDRRVRQLVAAGKLTNHGTAGRILLDLAEIEDRGTHRDAEVTA